MIINAVNILVQEIFIWVSGNFRRRNSQKGNYRVSDLLCGTSLLTGAWGSEWLLSTPNPTPTPAPGRWPLPLGAPDQSTFTHAGEQCKGGPEASLGIYLNSLHAKQSFPLQESFYN